MFRNAVILLTIFSILGAVRLIFCTQVKGFLDGISNSKKET